MEQSSYKLGGATTADVFIAIDPDADPTAQLRIFSPVGYNANLTAAPGTEIGNVVARVKAKALGGALLTLAGKVLVADPTNPTIQAAATQCTRARRPHSSIWVLNTSLQGQTVAIPVFVDQVGPLVVTDGLPALARHPRGDGRGEVRRAALRGRLHDQERVHQRRHERRLRVGGHLHAVHARHGHAEPERHARGAHAGGPALVADAASAWRRSGASSSSAS